MHTPVARGLSFRVRQRNVILFTIVLGSKPFFWPIYTAACTLLGRGNFGCIFPHLNKAAKNDNIAARDSVFVLSILFYGDQFSHNLASRFGGQFAALNARVGSKSHHKVGG